MTIYLGENIRKLRRERELTQETLADFLGVTFQSVSKWERGESYPDITMLPEIASFFNVSVDDLLGVDKAQKEQKINEYLNIYDTVQLKDASLAFTEFQRAVKEFPGDFRILIRYMELLKTEKGYVLDPDYEKASRELLAIYENIQRHCTDDDIRMWSKRIVIEHLLAKFDCTCDENGKYGVFTEYLKQAEDIISSLPAMSDSKEYMSLWSRDESNNSIRTVEELLYLLENSILICYLHNNNFSIAYKIELLNYMQGLFNLIYTNGDYGKNCWGRLWNYGYLGHFYHQVGDDKNALKHLKIAAEYAVELDKNPECSEHAAWFYERGKIYRETNASQFMKIVMSDHYPLSDEFKSTDEFKKIIEMLE